MSPGETQPERSTEPQEAAISPLESEEYVEQAHFFKILGERLVENEPAQEVLASVREEILATTKLPMAIDFLLSELRHQGAFADGMKQLDHYFSAFQSYVIDEAENDRRRFDLRIGLEILSREAIYRTEKTLSRQGLFMFQFEALCRNRLSYDQGLEAMARDRSYNETWQEWLLTVRRQLGIVELADLIYVRSEYYREKQAQSGVESDLTEGQLLFGRREGRIAWANRSKDPLMLFSAMQRHLGYPQVPRTKEADPEERLLPALARRVEQLETRMKIIQDEQKGGINLEQFYTSKQDDPR